MARNSRAGQDTAAPERPWRHPRETYRLFGHTGALEALEREREAGTLHHGLLICGQRGTGKATLAYALARRLLTGKRGTLADDPDLPAVRQIAANAHPDLLALDADESTGITRIINVEAVRDLVAFFSLTSGMSGENDYRIGIIDRADDMNTASANALLKILEEPPRHALLMLVCETPGRLPATIRSRCRRIQLDPLEPADLRAAVEHAGGEMPSGEEPFRDAWVAGSVLRALMTSDPLIAGTIAETGKLLRELPAPDQAALTAFAARFASREARAAFDVVFELVDLHLAEQARRAAAGEGGGIHYAAAIADTARSIGRLKREADTLNLDRTRTLLAAFRELTLALAPQP